MLHMRGCGDGLRVNVEPSTTFELGPVLPGTEDCMQELFLCNPTNYTIEVGTARGSKPEIPSDAKGVQRGLRHEVSGGGVLPPCLRQASGLIRRASGLRLGWVLAEFKV